MFRERDREIQTDRERVRDGEGGRGVVSYEVLRC